MWSDKYSMTQNNQWVICVFQRDEYDSEKGELTFGDTLEFMPEGFDFIMMLYDIFFIPLIAIIPLWVLIMGREKKLINFIIKLVRKIKH